MLYPPDNLYMMKRRFGPLLYTAERQRRLRLACVCVCICAHTRSVWCARAHVYGSRRDWRQAIATRVRSRAGFRWSHLLRLPLLLTEPSGEVSSVHHRRRAISPSLPHRRRSLMRWAYIDVCVRSAAAASPTHTHNRGWSNRDRFVWRRGPMSTTNIAIILRAVVALCVHVCMLSSDKWHSVRDRLMWPI